MESRRGRRRVTASIAQKTGQRNRQSPITEPNRIPTGIASSTPSNTAAGPTTKTRNTQSITQPTRGSHHGLLYPPANNHAANTGDQAAVAAGAATTATRHLPWRGGAHATRRTQLRQHRHFSGHPESRCCWWRCASTAYPPNSSNAAPSKCTASSSKANDRTAASQAWNRPAAE